MPKLLSFSGYSNFMWKPGETKSTGKKGNQEILFEPLYIWRDITLNVLAEKCIE